MSDIFCHHQAPFVVGQERTLEEWTFGHTHDPIEKKRVATVTVRKVEQRIDREYNYVFQRVEQVTYPYVTLELDGKLYLRRVIYTGIE